MIKHKRSLLFILCFFAHVSASEKVYANIINVCQYKNISCYQFLLDSINVNSNQKNIDNAIYIISNLKNNQAWKNNSLGILYMLKKDKVSLAKAEKLLMDAYSQGVGSATQNLAEYYFLINDVRKSIKFLDIVKSYNYKFPEKQYINWARLYGQILYLKSEDDESKVNGLELLQHIKEYDESGVAYYIIGFHMFENNEIRFGLEHLNMASSLGRLDAIMLLGDIYYNGYKTNGDKAVAKTYYLKAAKQKSGRAHYNLAMIYRMESDVTKMRMHLTLAVKYGNKKAITLFEKLNNR